MKTLGHMLDILSAKINAIALEGGSAGRKLALRNFDQLVEGCEEDLPCLLELRSMIEKVSLEEWQQAAEPH